jgi:hypothetical protein
MELVVNLGGSHGGAPAASDLDCEAELIDSCVAEGIGLYWQYEKWLRRNESRVWSMLGATGAIYALRRSCWTPLPAATLLDDVLAPMRAVLGGHRIVFEERAVAFDRASTDAMAESRRKTRTLAGNYQILMQELRLLVPFLNPVWLKCVADRATDRAVGARGLFIASFGSPGNVAYAVVPPPGVLRARHLGALFEAPRSRVAFTIVTMNISVVAGLAALRRREVWR